MKYVARGKGSNFPACPTWCDGACYAEGETADAVFGIAHMRFYNGRDEDVAILVEQDDKMSPAEAGVWISHPATITVLRDLRPAEFSIRDLSPKQAYALADLVHNDDLACRLLEAVEAIAPELTAVSA